MNDQWDSGFIKIRGHKHLTETIKRILDDYWDETR